MILMTHLVKLALVRTAEYSRWYVYIDDDCWCIRIIGAKKTIWHWAILEHVCSICLSHVVRFINTCNYHIDFIVWQLLIAFTNISLLFPCHRMQCVIQYSHWTNVYDVLMYLSQPWQTIFDWHHQFYSGCDLGLFHLGCTWKSFDYCFIDRSVVDNTIIIYGIQNVSLFCSQMIYYLRS